MQPQEPTCALNLRRFSVDLKWKCKQKAAARKETLAQYVERVLREDVEQVAKDNQGKSTAKRKSS
jgi:hypothetical protein